MRKAVDASKGSFDSLAQIQRKGFGNGAIDGYVIADGINLVRMQQGVMVVELVIELRNSSILDSDLGIDGWGRGYG